MGVLVFPFCIYRLDYDGILEQEKPQISLLRVVRAVLVVYTCAHLPRRTLLLPTHSIHHHHSGNSVSNIYVGGSNVDTCR